jgi:hypothetical protein
MAHEVAEVVLNGRKSLALGVVGEGFSVALAVLGDVALPCFKDGKADLLRRGEAALGGPGEERGKVGAPVVYG